MEARGGSRYASSRKGGERLAPALGLEQMSEQVSMQKSTQAAWLMRSWLQMAHSQAAVLVAKLMAHRVL